jgi:hypothetical protein
MNLNLDKWKTCYSKANLDNLRKAIDDYEYEVFKVLGPCKQCRECKCKKMKDELPLNVYQIGRTEERLCFYCSCHFICDVNSCRIICYECEEESDYLKYNPLPTDGE